jgi:hypothetical protein
MCISLEFSKGGKNYRKTNFFLLKNLWKLFDARILHIFEIPLLLIPFAPNFEEIFFQLIRDNAIILEVKRSNKIGTVKYFKKRFFIN